MPRIVKSSTPSMPVLHCLNKNAAGVDVGASEVYVAVPPDRDSQPVRRFASFTEDLHAAANWLKSCGIETVAMESTGVYWIPLFQILEARGFKVLLVNARHVKNVTRASPMFPIVNGCNISTRWDCCAAPFDRTNWYVACVRSCVTATVW